MRRIGNTYVYVSREGCNIRYIVDSHEFKV
jgi:hypothetical protein